MQSFLQGNQTFLHPLCELSAKTWVANFPCKLDGPSMAPCKAFTSCEHQPCKSSRRHKRKAPKALSTCKLKLRHLPNRTHAKAAWDVCELTIRRIEMVLGEQKWCFGDHHRGLGDQRERVTVLGCLCRALPGSSFCPLCSSFSSSFYRLAASPPSPHFRECF